MSERSKLTAAITRLINAGWKVQRIAEELDCDLAAVTQLAARARLRNVAAAETARIYAAPISRIDEPLIAANRRRAKGRP